MRRYLVQIPAATLLALLTAAALGACGSGGGSGASDDAASRSTSSSTTSTSSTSDGTGTERPTTTVVADPGSPSGAEAPETAPAPPAPEASDPGTHYLCPEGGTAEVEALQSAVDHGHQPWRMSAADVATACTFGGGDVEATGPTSYRVTSTDTGEAVLVEVAQPLGPGTIWVVTSVTPAT
jgi:hypothetical protein